MRPGLSPLSRLIAALTDNLEIRRGLKGFEAIEVWPEIVGASVAAHAWGHAIRDDTLLVSTDSPVWAHQLQLLEPQLIAKLRDRLGPDCPVARLRFVAAARPAASASSAVPVGASRPRKGAGRAPAAVSASERKALDQAAATTGDPELAAALLGALRAQLGPPTVRKPQLDATNGEATDGPRS